MLTNAQLFNPGLCASAVLLIVRQGVWYCFRVYVDPRRYYMSLATSTVHLIVI